MTTWEARSAEALEEIAGVIHDAYRDAPRAEREVAVDPGAGDADAGMLTIRGVSGDVAPYVARRAGRIAESQRRVR